MLTGEVKKELIGIMTTLVNKHQEARAAVSDDVIDTFMSIRKLHFQLFFYKIKFNLFNFINE